MLVAQGMGELRQLSGQLSGEGAPDPLVKLKEQELAQRAQADAAKQQLEQQKIMQGDRALQQKAAIDQQRISSSEDIADTKANIALMRLQQTERNMQNAP
jgi:hypothetical protein